MVGIPLRQNAFSPIVETNASHEHKRHVSFVLVAMRFAALVRPIVFVGLSLSGGKAFSKNALQMVALLISIASTPAFSRGEATSSISSTVARPWRNS